MKATRRSSAGFTLVELLIVVGIIAIVAAIAIPSLIRARVSANESATIGDIRTMISAEAAYHGASGGFYGTPDCLLAPNGPGCIPNYPATSPTFIDSQLAALGSKAGYTRSFIANAIPGGLSCYVFHATPSSPGMTGVRGFAGDCSAQICFTQDGSLVPTIAGAAMNPTCDPLR